MSDSEQVDSFNPMLMILWVLQLIILGMDYSGDNKVTWSIPIIGSFLVIQIYMVWKTNYDKMMQEQRESQSQAMGGDLVKNTPLIQQGGSIAEANKAKSSSPMINLGIAPSLKKDDSSSKGNSDG